MSEQAELLNNIREKITAINIELIEGLPDISESTATCPVGSVLLSCMCHVGLNGAKGCAKWFAIGMTCYAMGDTSTPIIA